MIREYKALQSFPLKPGSSFARPRQSLPERVSLGDPATDVMTDLNKVTMLSVRTYTTLDRANARMIRHGVRMLLVLDDNEQVAGLLTATDVLGGKPMRFLQNTGGAHADILVRDIMTTQRELEVMRIEDVRNARVGHIVATLKKSNRQHGLVVEEGADGKQSVCGLFSATQIARQSGLQVHRSELASTFAEIEAAIACC